MHLNPTIIHPLSLLLSLSLKLSLLCLFLLVGCQNNPYKQGETLYRYYCENCHMQDGSGLANLIPALGSSEIFRSETGKLVCLIRNGRPVNVLTGQKMPANTTMNDVEMTNLINFLGSKYAQNAQSVQVQEVKKILLNCQMN